MGKTDEEPKNCIKLLNMLNVVNTLLLNMELKFVILLLAFTFCLLNYCGQKLALSDIYIAKKIRIKCLNSSLKGSCCTS